MNKNLLILVLALCGCICLMVGLALYGRTSLSDAIVGEWQGGRIIIKIGPETIQRAIVESSGRIHWGGGKTYTVKNVNDAEKKITISTDNKTVLIEMSDIFEGIIIDGTLYSKRVR